MHPLCIIEVGLDMWTFTGYFFLTFCCKLSESLTHHGSQFPEGEAENCRKPAFRCKSGTGPNMQWHGTTWLRFWTVQTHDSQRSRVWPESPLCAISIHFYPCFGFDIFARLFIASPFIEKRAIYIHHGVRAGWPSSTFHTAQDEVKRLLEEFAAYTLANAKAEVGRMQIRMLYNYLVKHKFRFIGRVSSVFDFSCNCACVVGEYGTRTSRHLFTFHKFQTWTWNDLKQHP